MNWPMVAERDGRLVRLAMAKGMKVRRLQGIIGIKRCFDQEAAAHAKNLLNTAHFFFLYGPRKISFFKRDGEDHEASGSSPGGRKR